MRHKGPSAVWGQGGRLLIAMVLTLFTILYNDVYVDVALPKYLGIRFEPPHHVLHPIGQIGAGSPANDQNLI